MPVQAQYRLLRASLARDNPVFEEERTPAYCRQQENPLFEEGLGTAMTGGVPGGPYAKSCSAYSHMQTSR